MSSLENPRDIAGIGEKIGHLLQGHQWADASRALSECANALGPDDLKGLALAAYRANSDTTITFEPAFELKKVAALDPVTHIASSRFERAFAGVEVGLNVPGSDERPVLITDAKDLAPLVLKFASVYEQLGLSAQNSQDC
jgi:hypothetical protein